MKTRFGGKNAAEIGFPGWNWRHAGKNLPWGAVKAEGMAVIFNNLVEEFAFGGASTPEENFLVVVLFGLMKLAAQGQDNVAVLGVVVFAQAI